VSWQGPLLTKFTYIYDVLEVTGLVDRFDDANDPGGDELHLRIEQPASYIGPHQGLQGYSPGCRVY
jgi:hypothetical protein